MITNIQYPKSFIMMYLPKQLVDFKKYTPDLEFPESKLDIFFSSIKPIDKIVNNYYFVYHYCPQTNLYHMSVVFKLKKGLKFDINKVSKKILKYWNFNVEDNGLNTIQKTVSYEIMKSIVNPDDISGFHVNGSSKCYNTSIH